MKKNGTALLIIFFLGMRAYSFEESWISAGIEFGNFFDSNPNSMSPLKPSATVLGLNFNQYSFWNDMAFGYFLHNSILFIGMTSLKDDIENFKGFKNESTLGAAFRFAITDYFKLLVTLGLNLVFLNAYYKNIAGDALYSMENLNFGFSSSTELKYEIGDKRVFCTIGLRTTLGCLNHTSVLSQSIEYSQWYWDFLFGMKPYINIGLNLFNTGTRLGIPEK
jgi:hypothetical protein